MSSGSLDTSDFQAKISAALAKQQAGVLTGLWAAGEHVLGVSNTQVPFEEGDLAASGAVSQDASGATAISYDTPYAVRQHEDLSMQHDAGRNAKFLENALNSESAIVQGIISTALRGTLGS